MRAAARPVPVLGERLYFVAFVDRPDGRRPLKVPAIIRFDADVLAALKAGGPGWQTRVNDALREWLKSHPEGR
nr:BrnA antitoxin family protein [Azohydromonas aeria]